MSNLPTITEVAADEKLLRRLAGEVINPGPWQHKTLRNGTTCIKCGMEKPPSDTWGQIREHSSCPIPDPASGSLADIVSQLIKKCDPEVLMKSWCQMHHSFGRQTIYHDYAWWIFEATPSEQSVCLLAVLLPERVKT